MTYPVLIADDEPLARRKLRDLLDGVSWLRCVGETGDGPATITAIDTLRPALVFLDIRMPGATGLEVLAAVTHTPHVIFTTAYDAYAVTAFELHALDYLLKPFGEARFRAALARAQDVLQRDDVPAEALRRAHEALDPQTPPHRLFVRERGRIVPLDVAAIEHLEAQDDYVMIHTADRRALAHVRLGDLEERLGGARFVRVHRSHVVNLDHVTALAPYDGGRLQVTLQSGRTVVASRSGSRRLREWVL